MRTPGRSTREQAAVLRETSTRWRGLGHRQDMRMSPLFLGHTVLR